MAYNRFSLKSLSGDADSTDSGVFIMASIGIALVIFNIVYYLFIQFNVVGIVMNCFFAWMYFNLAQNKKWARVLSVIFHSLIASVLVLVCGAMFIVAGNKAIEDIGRCIEVSAPTIFSKIFLTVWLFYIFGLLFYLLSPKPKLQLK
ncbi:MAG: hypothetical protein Q8O30_12950 [Candidatus Omnitrophota bacterium]|nr:hypothetical protein [Candidatus Omnitrophota bacterium]